MTMSINTRSIIQTQQFIAAIAVLILRGRDIAADKKISIFELFSLAREWPVFKEALDGIADVPAELLNLTDAEAEQVGEQIAALMVELGFPHRSGDITKELVSLAAEGVGVWQRIINLPPVPDIVA
jgi:hypothetical protein